MPPELPFLDKPTFAKICQSFIEKIPEYQYTSLQYSVKYSPYDPEETYLVIKKSILHQSNQADGSEEIEIEVDGHDDDEIVIFGEDDAKTIEHGPTTHTVEYHILLSPIYSVPVLYFNIYPISIASAPVHNISDVYSVLVPAHRLQDIESIGVQGGISQGDHPILQRPFWFIHPCNTAEALKEWGEGLNLENYLMIWLGMVQDVVRLR